MTATQMTATQIRAAQMRAAQKRTALKRWIVASLLPVTALPVALLGGCGGAQRGPAQPPAPLFTLVRRGAWLHEQPDVQSRAARDPVFASKPYQLGRAVSMEVMRQEGQWVAVRPILQPDRPPHSARPCVSTPVALRRLDILLWVRRQDLVPATRLEAEHHYRDGTAIALRAGVPAALNTPLKDPKRSIYAVRPGRFRFNTVLADRAIGLFWRASPPFDNSPSHERVTKKAELRFGRTANVLDTYRWATLYVQERISRTTGELVLVRGRCASLRVFVAAEHVVGVETGGLGLLGGLSGSGGPNPPVMTIPPGVELSWRDGQRAGATAGTLRVNNETSDSSDLRRCFSWSLRTFWSKGATNRSEADLVLCAPRAAVR